MAKIFDCTTEGGKEIWDLIFVRATKQRTPLNIAMIDNLLDLLSVVKNNDSIVDVCLLLVQHLSKEKKCKDHYNQYRIAILAKISVYFSSEKAKNVEKNRALIDRTRSGFVTVIATTLAQFENVIEELATSLRSIFKIYLQESVRFLRFLQKFTVLMHILPVFTDKLQRATFD